MPTNQELFNECFSHVMKQGKQARRAGSCDYLTPEGLSCALGGPIIARGLYDSDIEYCTPAIVLKYLKGDRLSFSQSFKAPILREILNRWGIELSQYQFLSEIQACHDEYSGPAEQFMDYFRSDALDLALENFLNADVLYNLKG